MRSSLAPDSAPSYWPSPRTVALLLLLAGYALALRHGHLSWTSLPWFVLLAASGLGVRAPQPGIRIASHTLFVGLAVGLALHILPGFGNAPVWHAVRLGENAVPYSFYLNLDKPLIGLWLLWACPWVVGPARWRQIAGTVLRVAPITLLGCLGLGWGLQAIAWDPKWPPQAGLWLANNVLLVCVTEEVLFRGYLLGALLRVGGRDKARHVGATTPWFVLLLSACLFGLAHLAGGWPLVALASVAGVGYGWAYLRGGLLAAVAVHALLNLAHFGLFSYPLKLSL